MKLFILGLFVMAGVQAHAFTDFCYESVEVQLSVESIGKDWRYFDLKVLGEIQINEIAANPHKWSNQLTDKNLMEIEGYITGGGHEFYLYRTTHIDGASAQELVVVNASSCIESSRYLVVTY